MYGLPLCEKCHVFPSWTWCPCCDEWLCLSCYDIEHAGIDGDDGDEFDEDDGQENVFDIEGVI